MSDLAFAEAALTGLTSAQKQLYSGPDAIQNHAEEFERVMPSLIIPRIEPGHEHTDGKFPFNLKFSFATQSVIRVDLPEIKVSDFYSEATPSTKESRGKTKVEIRFAPYIGNRIVSSYSLFLGLNKRVTTSHNSHVLNHILVRGQIPKIDEKIQSLGTDPSLTEWSQHIPATTLCVFVPSVYSTNAGSHLPLMHFRDSPDRPFEQFTFERELGNLIQVRITKVVENEGKLTQEILEVPLKNCSVKSGSLFTNTKLEAQWKIPIPDWIVFYSQLTREQEEWHSHRHRDPNWQPQFYYSDILSQISKNPVALGSTETFTLRPNYPTTAVHWVCRNDHHHLAGNHFMYLDQKGQNPSQTYQILRDKDVIFEGDQTMSNQIMPLVLGYSSAGSSPVLSALRKSSNSHYFSHEVPAGDCQFGVQVANMELLIKLGSSSSVQSQVNPVQEDDIMITTKPTVLPEESNETFHLIFFQEVIRSWTWKVVNDRIHGCTVSQEHAD